MKKNLITTVYVVFVSCLLTAYNPPRGGEEIYRLYAPEFLANGETSISMLSAESDAVNPAASGGEQRVTLDLNYSILSDFSASGTTGHSVNLGATFPTRVGVFSGSFHFLHSPFASVMNLGTVGTLNFSFAKDLFPDLNVGAGLHGTIASREQVDWGLALDLGFIHSPGDFWFMKDFRWGGAFRNIGKWVNPNGPAFTGFPSSFTPAVGAGFSVFGTDMFRMDLDGDLSFPSFQNLRFKLGTGLTFMDFIRLDASMVFDVYDLVNAPSRSLVPGIGITVDLNKNKKAASGTPESWKDSQVGIRAAAAPFYGNIWAFGTGLNVNLGVLDRNPPVITIEYPQVRYVSANHDGKSDYLEFPVTITDERYVSGYRFVVTNDRGETVREIRNKELRPENSSLQGIVDRLLAVKSGIDVPERMRWDGSLDTGAAAPDGTYSFFIEAWDDNGNIGKTGVSTVVLDMKAPEIQLAVPGNPADLIFSPDGDGNKDSLTFVQSGSVEDLWEGILTDPSGQAVRTFKWTSTQPSSFPWDGKNGEGILVPDGVYSYIVKSTDRAENSSERRLENIIINTQQPPIGLAITNAYFSPDGNGVQDDIRIKPDISLPESIGNWKLTVKNGSGSVVRNLKRENDPSGEIPDSIVFDGKDDAGIRLAEGSYTAELKVLYQNGHNPATVSPAFVLDVTPPSAEITIEHPVFSPNGDGKKETVSFYQNTSPEETWRGEILNPSGETVHADAWSGKADPVFTWDGRGTDLKILPDGKYFYALSSTDRAGNSVTSGKNQVVIDTRETPVAVSTQDEAFSPNSDGLKDRIDLLPQVRMTDGIEVWELSIHEENGKPVRTQRASSRDAVRFLWDGKSDDGSISPDGRYFAQLKLRYLHGNEPVARTGLFVLDTIPPSGTVKLNYTVFSPNSDGNKDEIAISQETTKEARWIGAILGENNRVVRSFSWIGEADKSLSWDGRGDDKLVQPDGKYFYRLTSIDLAGNKGIAQSEGFEINTEKTPLFISAEYDAFSPNSDGVKDALRFLPQIKIMDGIQNYHLTIHDGDGKIVRNYRGEDDADRLPTWDGLDDSGKRVPDGRYSAQLRLSYLNGNAPEAKTSAFIVDTVAPTATVKVDYPVFSPNGDGRKDLITLSQGTSREGNWTGTIYSDSGKPVKAFGWSGEAEAKIFWDGRGNDKSIVPDGQYRYQITALDDAGNKGGSQAVFFEVNTVDTPVFISSDSVSFSPNGDGTKDKVNLFPQAKTEKGLSAFELLITSEAGPVRTFSGKTTVPGSFSWDGKGSDGKLVRDGKYDAILKAVYENGNEPESNTVELIVDTVRPEILVTPDITIFSPNGDGLKDSVAFRQTSSNEDLWEGRIVSEKGETVRKFSWKGRATDLSWDGRDQNGNVVKDGSYAYTVSSVDPAGNGTEVASVPVSVDNRGTIVFLTAGRHGFSPNDDGLADDIVFSPYVNLKDGIESWSLTLSDEAGTRQKVFSGTGLPPTSVAWDGKNDAGQIRDGLYTGKLVVVYAKGDRPAASTREILLDVTPPQVTVNLKPMPFSPDNDGIDDELEIGLSVRDRSPLDGWDFRIFDPAGHEFVSFGGSGTPTENLRWDGRSKSAELAQAAEDYEYVMKISDSLGNIAVQKGSIPVDVLVIRDDDRLKIRISGISFPPYRADLIWDDAEASDKNLRILKRMSEILNKYASYRIRIEGHAVSEYWDIPKRAEREEIEELQPLSLKRAESVKQKLVELGVIASRITTLGMGGKEPVVPHGDLENRWKSRRVEFILIK